MGIKRGKSVKTYKKQKTKITSESLKNFFLKSDKSDLLTMLFIKELCREELWEPYALRHNKR